jgi:hypothetical protein
MMLLATKPTIKIVSHPCFFVEERVSCHKLLFLGPLGTVNRTRIIMVASVEVNFVVLRLRGRSITSKRVELSVSKSFI